MSGKLQLRLWMLIKSTFGRQFLFCEKVGISESHLSRILTGRVDPGLKLKRKIAEVFDMDPSEVFED